jgi:hypothetical protein
MSTRKISVSEKRRRNDAARDQVLGEVAQEERTAHNELRISKSKDNAVTVLGRPSEYSVEEADKICAWIGEGRSLRSYCRLEHRSLETVYRWLRERRDFRERYARAHDDRADSLADEICDIADEVASGTLEQIQAARLRVDARKWVASKLKPAKWGEYQPNTTSAPVIFNLGIRSTHTQPPTIDAKPLIPLVSGPGS